MIHTFEKEAKLFSIGDWVGYNDGTLLIRSSLCTSRDLSRRQAIRNKYLLYSDPEVPDLARDFLLDFVANTSEIGVSRLPLGLPVEEEVFDLYTTSTAGGKLLAAGTKNGNNVLRRLGERKCKICLLPSGLCACGGGVPMAFVSLLPDARLAEAVRMLKNLTKELRVPVVLHPSRKLTKQGEI